MTTNTPETCRVLRCKAIATHAVTWPQSSPIDPTPFSANYCERHAVDKSDAGTTATVTKLANLCGLCGSSEGPCCDCAARSDAAGYCAKCGHHYREHNLTAPGGTCATCQAVDGGLRCWHYRGAAPDAAGHGRQQDASQARTSLGGAVVAFLGRRRDQLGDLSPTLERKVAGRVPFTVDDVDDLARRLGLEDGWALVELAHAEAVR